jgi:hypothetical protein
MKIAEYFILSALVICGIGRWEPAGPSGVVCIHTLQLPDDKLQCMERPHPTPFKINQATGPILTTEINLKAIIGADGKWTANFTPIETETNPFCGGHAQMADGSILVIGGDDRPNRLWSGKEFFQVGLKNKKIYKPCQDKECIGSWQELEPMTSERWYPSVTTLADGTHIIVGGSKKPIDIEKSGPEINNPTYEYYPSKSGSWPKNLDILNWAFPFSLYPAVFLMPSGKIFMMASNKSIILDPKDEAVSTTIPDLYDENHRPWIYPYLPTFTVLPMMKANNYKFTIQVCGGGEIAGELEKLASDHCWQISPEESNPKWIRIDNMPHKRVMLDSVILPTGKILYVNGASWGTAGGDAGQVQYARDPVKAADIFDPFATKDYWATLSSAKEARLYHSGALLISTGEVITSGSEMNNYQDYWNGDEKSRCFPRTNTTVCSDPFNTNLERFVPPYIEDVGSRPEISIKSKSLTHGSVFEIQVNGGARNIKMVTITRYSTSTHSTNHDQRLVELEIKGRSGDTIYALIPESSGMAPPGHWFVWAIDKEGVPSKGQTVLLTLGSPQIIEIPPDALMPTGGSIGVSPRLIGIFLCVFVINLV